MKKILLTLAGLIGILSFPLPLLAEKAVASGVDQRINEAMAPLTAFMFRIVFFSVPLGGVMVPFVLVWLIVAALVFTVYMKFINIRGFGHAIDLVRGVYDAPDQQGGEVSHFQALTAALSATVGLGNIAGVAVAITLGGPGATFWMIMGGLFGMSSKFVECTLGVKYRKINSNGSVSGGPMYYLSRGFAEKGFPGAGKVLAFFFALMCVGGSFGGGNMFQANQAFRQTVIATGGEQSLLFEQGWVFGLVMALLVGVVIIGGIKGIVRVTSKLVPVMVAIYVSASLFILFSSFDQLPAAFSAIVNGAFSPEAIYGGVIGVLIQGFKRAAFSNEAGIGSAPIAHSAVKTDEPVTEGLVALLEPFLDTVVICTMTALVIIISGLYIEQGSDGIALTSSAFGQAISWFPYILSVAVLLFAFSTMISWSYYGLKAWTYIFGESRLADVSYKLLFCMFIVIGSAMNLGTVIDFTDAMIFAMSFPNIIGLYILAPTVRRELDDYFLRLNEGEIRRFR
ncbi:MAG: alanine:cation symporter family protein [Prosthecochloris sp.]|nr:MULTISPECIES: alanine/glycine:cation symporter family protein [Prosthecochloris]MCW8797385.1 alanine:cation symporter family protein [Prosthecochloris sp.]NEX11488.1 alanine:cation symporter family protein [Prosthecochloris sp.]RDD29576.1 alanine:cation symporter family protein [Prosthecochloris sp. ZM]